MALQDRKKYDFASVGITATANRTGFSDPNESKPIGILTPLKFGNGNDGIFKMSQELTTQVGDNLRNLISTNHGERLMLYDFGANLEELIFELGAEDVDTEAVIRIKTAVEKYMPYIQLLTFETFEPPVTTNTGLAYIGIKIRYMVPDASSKEMEEEIILAAAG